MSKESEYPKLMTKGSALQPQRFWDYKEAANADEERGLRAIGYVKSNRG